MIHKIILIICAICIGCLMRANLNSHAKYPKLDEYIKGTLAMDWLVMVVLFIYLIYRIVTM